MAWSEGRRPLGVFYIHRMKWIEWTLAVTLWSWWQHCKHCHGYYYNFFSAQGISDTEGEEKILLLLLLLLLKWERMGMPFSGPSYPQSGVPRPQTAFSRGNARFQDGKIVSWERNFSSELIKLNLVKITAWLEMQGPAAKSNGAHNFLQRPIIFIVPTTLKLHLTHGVSLLYSEKL